MLRAMSMSLRRSRLFFLLASLLALACLAVACGGANRSRGPARVASSTRSVAPPPARVEGLYAADEALRDALSGVREYVGTGSWPGISRMQACVFRNQRVLVVNVYCSLTETQAFRIDVYSPTRGRVRIYAESNGPVSALKRRDYFTFTAESEPPPGPAARMVPLSLTMSFEQLRDYDEKRYSAYLPACYGGQELSRKRGGCLGTLAARNGEWTTRNSAFLDQANEDWYRMVREMRALAKRYGTEPQ
jgi:hypothetical protein